MVYLKFFLNQVVSSTRNKVDRKKNDTIRTINILCVYILCNHPKDLPVVFDGSDVVCVDRDDHNHNYVHLKSMNQKLTSFWWVI